MFISCLCFIVVVCLMLIFFNCRWLLLIIRVIVFSVFVGVLFCINRCKWGNCFSRVCSFVFSVISWWCLKCCLVFLCCLSNFGQRLRFVLMRKVWLLMVFIWIGCLFVLSKVSMFCFVLFLGRLWQWLKKLNVFCGSMLNSMLLGNIVWVIVLMVLLLLIIIIVLLCFCVCVIVCCVSVGNWVGLLICRILCL